ncbi:hypothetical protein CAPTEDRAFT_222624 [Capitella teleta]|uniref:Histone deacetylase interacting domain-containing protein n=1 Tax=Capitella teleta TaxID=283909 RepID=R7TZG6_CAPTE|nr:hypothetical protein CAPTEDRAFT_222624 [Capitella teleta]|eukprot:ELT99328.1 hypothetical protein CAPTEDRAFT_222624 [Capitella teleta]
MTMRTLDPPHMPNIQIKYAQWMYSQPMLVGWNRKPVGRRTVAAKKISAGKATQQQHRLGSSRVVVCEPCDMTTKQFCDLVQRRFKNNPAIYRRFGEILQRLPAVSASLERLDLVKQLITLFDGHPDLVLNMNQFLPNEYCIEIQHDAVVIKVFEEFGQAGLVDTGHGRSITDPSKPLPSLGTSVPSIAYIMNVKKAYADDPNVYSAFMGVLKHYHSKKANELSTVNQVVGLFRTRPDLVLGFNEFLPPGFSIHMYEKSGYVVEYPNEAEGGVARVKIGVGAKAERKKKK